MSCESCSTTDKFGATPANIKWTVVRGDTAKLRVQFFEDNEITAFDTSTWLYSATAYNPATQTTVALVVVPGTGYIDIVANASVTALWGTGQENILLEMDFDLEITIPELVSGVEDTVWTPVIGAITVLADITPRGL
jgi:hypothetical protein